MLNGHPSGIPGTKQVSNGFTVGTAVQVSQLNSKVPTAIQGLE